MNNCPEYIIDFFKSICDKIDDDEDYSFINNDLTFIKKLNKKLENNINKYFNIS